MRTPFQQARTEEAEGRARLRDAFRFVWDEPFVRTSAFLFGLANFIIPGLLFALVVIGKRQGLSGGEVGLLIAVFGACVLVGSLVASRVRRLLPTRVVMLLEFWAWTGCTAFVVWPSVYVLLAGMVPAALVIPSTDSVVHAYRIAITPDRLLGRAESVRRTISLAFSALGPICIGLLLGRTTERVTVGLLGAFALVLAVWATLSPVLRAAPNVTA